MSGSGDRDREKKSTSRRQNAGTAAGNGNAKDFLILPTAITANNVKRAYASEVLCFVHRTGKDGESLPLNVCLHTQKRKRKPCGKNDGNRSSDKDRPLW